MTDDDMQHSGSRWEPFPGSTGPALHGAVTAPLPGAATPDPAAPSMPAEDGRPYAATATALPADAVGAPQSRAGLSGRGAMAAVAAGFLLLGGVGGFAVVHATTGDGGAGTGSPTVQGGVPGGGPDGDDGFRSHFRDDDGDGNGFGAGQGAPAPGGSGPGTVPGGQGTTGDDGTSGTT